MIYEIRHCVLFHCVCAKWVLFKKIFKYFKQNLHFNMNISLSKHGIQHIQYKWIKIPFCRQSVVLDLAPPPDGKGAVLTTTLWLDQAEPWSAHHRQTTSYPERKETAIILLCKHYGQWWKTNDWEHQISSDFNNYHK